MRTRLQYFSRHFRYLTFLLLLLGMAHQASADGGYYIGGSVGSAGLELSDSGANFDESDGSVKIFGGYNFDLTVFDFAIEGSYLDLGGPSAMVLGENLSVDVTAWDIFGLVGLELGPIGVFGKVGMINWDTDLSFGGVSSNESGSDPAYGVGARFSLGSIELRAEYEMFDIGVDNISSSDLSMVSVGLSWTF